MEAVNPYESPKSRTLNITSETYQPKLFSINGRIGRIRYLAYSLIAMLVYGFVVSIIAAIAIPSISGASEAMMGFVIIALYAPLIIFSIFLMKRRLNDLNMSGWWQLIAYIPFIGALFALYMLIWPGKKESNKYGPPPTKNSPVLVLAGLVMPLFVAGILAAIAIPAYQDYVTRAQQVSQLSR